MNPLRDAPAIVRAALRDSGLRLLLAAVLDVGDSRHCLPRCLPVGGWPRHRRKQRVLPDPRDDGAEPRRGPFQP